MGNKNQKHSSSKALPSILSDINRDIKALNSSILIISQKMKYLARNEKILGRNLIVLNKKIADLRSQMQTGLPVARPVEYAAAAELPPELAENVARMQAQLSLIQNSVKDLGRQVRECVKADEIAELKYLVESIDPLEFVTVGQMQKVLGKKLSARKAKPKPAKKKKAKKTRKKKAGKKKAKRK